MSVGNGKLLAYLAAKGEIVSTQYREDVVLVHCRIPQKYLGRINYDDAIVTPHNAAGWIEESGDRDEVEPEVAVESEREAVVPPPVDETAISPVEAPRD